MWNGSGSGSFGWLTWSGSPSEPTLASSLVLPGNGDSHVNPDDPGDHALSSGDWVFSYPGSFFGGGCGIIPCFE